MKRKQILKAVIVGIIACSASYASAQEVKDTPRCKSWQDKLNGLQGEAASLGGQVSCRNLKRLAQIQDDASNFFRQCVDGGASEAASWKELANRARAQIRDSYAGGC